MLFETPAAAATVGVRTTATAVTCEAATSHTGFMKKTEELEWTRSENLNWSPTDSQSAQTPSCLRLRLRLFARASK